MSKSELPRFDKYAHYGASLRAPARVACALDAVYREVRAGATPQTLREDFCGTFALCCEWVRIGPERRAVGVDPDPEPIAYGRARYWATLEPSDRDRVKLLQADVLSPSLPKADVICALDYSIFGFKTRTDVLAYFHNCHRTLEPGGVLALDCFGGPASRRQNVERRKIEGVTHILDQEGFDPVTHEATVHVHLHRKGEKKQLRAFTYDWRIWSVAELRDALLDSGFAAVRTCWEADSPGGGRDGELVLVDRVEGVPNRWKGLIVGVT